MYKGRGRYRTYWTIFLILAAAVILALAVGMGLTAKKAPGGEDSGARNGTLSQPEPEGGDSSASPADDPSAAPPDGSHPSDGLT